jgi:hypothetical protein
MTREQIRKKKKKQTMDSLILQEIVEKVIGEEIFHREFGAQGDKKIKM